MYLVSKPDTHGLAGSAIDEDVTSVRRPAGLDAVRCAQRVVDDQPLVWDPGEHGPRLNQSPQILHLRTRRPLQCFLEGYGGEAISRTLPARLGWSAGRWA